MRHRGLSRYGDIVQLNLWLLSLQGGKLQLKLHKTFSTLTCKLDVRHESYAMYSSSLQRLHRCVSLTLDGAASIKSDEIILDYVT